VTKLARSILLSTRMVITGSDTQRVFINFTSTFLFVGEKN